MNYKNRFLKKKVYTQKLNALPDEIIYAGVNSSSEMTIDFLGIPGKLGEIIFDVPVETLKDKVDDYVKRGEKFCIEISGLNNQEKIKQIGSIFNIHNLILNDILNLYQRPKVEYHDNYIFLEIDKLLFISEQGIAKTQISFLLSEHFLLIFQDNDRNFYSNFNSRLSEFQLETTLSSMLYLLYLVMDSIVDEYFLILEETSDKLEILEGAIIENQIDDKLVNLQKIRRDVHLIRHSIWPMREILFSLNKNEKLPIDPKLKIYFNDITDHVIQIIETLEGFRESIITLIDIYMSGISVKLNDVMKVLTVISTIFMPITFLAGFYGMNFKNQPEYDTKYGYVILIIVMIAIASGFIIYFKKKKWI